MSAWTIVKSGGRKHSRCQGNSQATRFGNGKENVVTFLLRFKTSPCTRKDSHNHRQCEYFHSMKDMRRNPYAEFYLPDDDDLKSIVERHYHPALFLTQKCSQPHNCPYGKYCAQAHETMELREVTSSMQEYLDHGSKITLASKLNTITLETYLPKQEKSPSANEVSDRRSKKWNSLMNHNLPISLEVMLPLSQCSKPWFMINASAEFFRFLQEQAMKEGLAQIEIRNNKWGDGEYGIAIRGNRFAQDAAIDQIIHYLFEFPSHFFVEDSMLLSSRVIEKLRERSWHDILGKYSNRAFIDITKEKMSICASNYPRNTGQQIISSVFEKVAFWMKQEGHDKFIDCCCCMDSYNFDEGVKCVNGHFYCGGKDSCTNAMVKDQLERIQHQDNKIVCLICNATVDTRSLAPFLSKTIWEKLEDARIDSKVNIRVQKLSHDFDRRLEAKIQEFMNEYGSLSNQIKLEAKRLAKHAQDDILNLKCPHCRAPYAEFTGCMALQCGTCKGYFCGYCHHGTETGSGAHDHVRQCLVNETNNGSYYATPEEIKVAQRKHRTRELKKFLQPLKKDIQNATVLELEQDLQYHGIQKAALFEFGNMQRELGQF